MAIHRVGGVAGPPVPPPSLPTICWPHVRDSLLLLATEIIIDLGFHYAEQLLPVTPGAGATTGTALVHRGNSLLVLCRSIAAAAEQYQKGLVRFERTPDIDGYPAGK